MEKRKKILITSLVVIALLICAAVIIWLCLRTPGETPAPEQTEPTIADTTAPSAGSSTTPPTEGQTNPTDPTESTVPSSPTDPTGTAAPTDPTETLAPSAPATQPTRQPATPTTEPTKPATQAPTKAPTQAATKAPTQAPTQPPALTQATTPPTTSPFTYHTPEDFCISVGETFQIDYTYHGDSSKLTWSCGFPEIATVENGIVTGISPGSVILKATDGTKIWRITVKVMAPEDRTVALDLNVDCPLYDGVTKYVGHYLQIGTLHSHTLKANGDWSDYVDYWDAASIHTDPGKPHAVTHKRNYYITSSNPEVVSVSNEYDEGFYDDFLRFNKPGTSVITITSWDGYSESYTIHVKAEYDCAPDDKKLTPGEFAYYATSVAVEDGMVPAYQLSAYLYTWYSEDELTWENAKRMGHSQAKREFYLDSPAALIVYVGFDESNGKHLFYNGSGSYPGYIDPYTPSKNTTGKIYFENDTLEIMEKTIKMIEVSGDTSNGIMTYTSSDPSVVTVSDGMMITQNPGAAVITVTYEGQGVGRSIQMLVNVTRDPTRMGVQLYEDVVTIYSLYATREIYCSHYYPGPLYWSTSDPTIATVNDEGVVTPHKSGQCILTVTDSISTDTCIIIVQ